MVSSGVRSQWFFGCFVRCNSDLPQETKNSWRGVSIKQLIHWKIRFSFIFTVDDIDNFIHYRDIPIQTCKNWILHICHLRFLKQLGQIELIGYLLIRCFSLSPPLRQCCWYTISNPTNVSFTKNVSILQYYGIDRHLAKDISLYTLLIRHKNTVWYLFHSKQNKENERKL